MPPWLLVAVGGALGSVSRYACSLFVTQRLGQSFPWGTLVVNVVGSFAIGVLAAFITAPQRAGSPIIRDFMMVGFLGGFTTFSAFSLQTLQLIRDGKMTAALMNVAASVVVCLIAVWLGFLLAARSATPS